MTATGTLFSMVGGKELRELIASVFSIGRLQGMNAAAEEWCKMHRPPEWSPEAMKLRARLLVREAGGDPVDLQTAEYVCEYAVLQATLVRYGTHTESPAEIEGWFRHAAGRLREPRPAQPQAEAPKKPATGMSKDEYARWLIGGGSKPRKRGP